MATIKLNITGMTCEMCVKHVTNALANVPGVTSVDVSLANREALVTFDKGVRPDAHALLESISEEGYSGEIAPGASA